MIAEAEGHAIASRGGWARAGNWVAVPYVDAKAAELLFRHKVISFLKADELFTGERIQLLLSWQETGFSVHNTVTVGQVMPRAPSGWLVTCYALRSVSRGCCGVVMIPFSIDGRREADSAVPRPPSMRWTFLLVKQVFSLMVLKLWFRRFHDQPVAA